jgi:hypothetical protein
MISHDLSNAATFTIEIAICQVFDIIHLSEIFLTYPDSNSTIEQVDD